MGAAFWWVYFVVGVVWTINIFPYRYRRDGLLKFCVCNILFWPLMAVAEDMKRIQ